METTIDLLDRAKKASGCETDYAFAKRHGLRQSSVSNYRNGKHHFDDATAELVAGILDMEPGYVIACCNAERQKDDAGKRRWARIAALLLASTLPPAAGAMELGQAQGQLQIMSAPNVYYVNRLRRLLALIGLNAGGINFA